MTCGIYKLSFNGTDKLYIGQSTNIEHRAQSHILAIKAGKAAKKLSDAFIQYGNPTLSILEECMEEELDLYENNTIEVYNSVENGFNTLSKAEDIPKPNNRGELNGHATSTNEEIIKLFHYLVNNPKIKLSKVASLLNIEYSKVLALASCTNHRWLKDAFPEDYAILESLVGTRSRYLSAEERGLHLPLLVSPLGEIYKVNNIREFARDHTLDYSCLNRLLNGKNKTHKGWKVQT